MQFVIRLIKENKFIIIKQSIAKDQFCQELYVPPRLAQYFQFVSLMHQDGSCLQNVSIDSFVALANRL